MTRLFVAVVPPAAVVARLGELERPDGTGVRWVPEHQWHVTLRFLGEVDRDGAVDALGRVERDRAFVEVGPAVGRLGERVICLPVTGLDELASAVEAATGHLGAPRGAVPYRGHLTLGRTRSDDTEVPLVGRPFAARFVADRMVLFASHPERGGHRHEAIAGWSLGGASDPG